MTRHLHWIIAIMLIALALPVQAKRPWHQRQDRPDIPAIAARLAKAAVMNDEQTKTFTSLFVECNTEMEKIHERYRLEDGKSLSSKQIEQNTDNRFAMARAILDLREKYYNKYKRFLSPEQIDRVYRTEKRLMGPPPGGHKKSGKGKGRRQRHQSGRHRIPRLGAAQSRQPRANARSVYVYPSYAHRATRGYASRARARRPQTDLLPTT